MDGQLIRRAPAQCTYGSRTGCNCEGTGAVMATIYHGTPMTPRAALLDVCAGRAMCVSFYRPDDVEAVEAISPAVMFRQRRVFILEGGAAQRRGLGGGSGLDPVFRLVGTAPIHARAMGGDPRYAGSAQPAQRCAAERLAFWATRRTPLAHGRADRAPIAAVRTIRPHLLGMDRKGQGDRLPSLSGANGRGRSSLGQSLARSPHDARDCGGLRLPLCQRGQYITGTEWMAL